MGSVHDGIPQLKARQLRQRYGLTVFIETGTHVGRTAVWASGEFELVITVEATERYWDIAFQKLKAYDNVTCVLCDSAVLLDGLEYLKPTMFWLDAHWSSDLEGERPLVVCPVLAELAAINQSDLPHVILVDDARLFTGKRGWPTFEEVAGLMAENGRRVWEEDDVIWAVPD